MFGTPLTESCIAQIYQLIEYLSKSEPSNQNPYLITVVFTSSPLWLSEADSTNLIAFKQWTSVLSAICPLTLINTFPLFWIVWMACTKEKDKFWEWVSTQINKPTGLEQSNVWRFYWPIPTCSYVLRSACGGSVSSAGEQCPAAIPEGAPQQRDRCRPGVRRLSPQWRGHAAQDFPGRVARAPAHTQTLPRTP